MLPLILQPLKTCCTMFRPNGMNQQLTKQTIMPTCSEAKASVTGTSNTVKPFNLAALKVGDLASKIILAN